MQKEECLAKAAAVANMILAGGGVVCLLTLLYLLSSYGWAGQREVTSRSGVLLYYVVPAVLATILLVSRRLEPAYQIIVATGFLSLAVSAYGVEGFLQISDSAASVPHKHIMTFPKEERKQIAAKLSKEFGIDFDTRDRHEVIADLRQQGVDAVPQTVLPVVERQTDNSSAPAIRIHGAAVMPLAGIANRVTVVCNETGKYLIYKSDKRGFHNPDGVWQAAPIDIAAVGNSLTLGACVSSERNFVALIRRRYPTTVNLGMPGEGPVHILGVLKEYAPALKPNIVLWFYAEANTFTELQIEQQSRILMSYLRDDFAQGLLERQQDIDRALMEHVTRQIALEKSRAARKRNKGSKVGDKFPGFIKLSALREKLGLVYGKAPAEPNELSAAEAAELEPDLILLRDILSKANARVRAWGGTLYFVYLPGWAHYAESPDTGAKGRTRILELVNSLGISIVDVAPAFQAHPDPLSLFPFRGRGRYKDEGHRLVADIVLDAISRRHPDGLGAKTVNFPAPTLPKFARAAKSPQPEDGKVNQP